MTSDFKNHIDEKFPFLSGKKLLLAVSGGIDSMVMAHLFQQNNFNIAVAHCNFNLRENESDADERFVRAFAEKNAIPVFATQFDTVAFAEDYKLSVQMAARELRYNWFTALLETENYDYLLTAHHADDNLETFLINLSRGTGIAGLTGIRFKNEKIIRPLLAFSRVSIEMYADANSVEWREDSSNASDRYLRNKIRHQIIPALKELKPDFLDAFGKTQKFLRETQNMADDAAILVYQQVAKVNGDEIHFDIDKFRMLPNYKSYLYQWLREFGFTAWEDIYELADGESGKQVFSQEYRLYKARHFLIVTAIKKANDAVFYIEENQAAVEYPIKMSVCKVNDISPVSNKTIFVDAEKLRFPLTLRKWKEGDDFQPFGMDGKSKKVSKIFKDEKFSLSEKENAWLLISSARVVWVIGIRADERFKVTHSTKNILQIALL